MSSTDDSELKAGHPPAAKVAGMRVAGTRHKHNSGGEIKPTEEEEEEFGTSPPKTDKHHQNLVVSGAVTKGDQDFPPQAVKAYHEKPVPAHDKRPSNPPHNIQQPRR